MDYTIELDENQLDIIEKILVEELVHIGVNTVLLIDLAGNVVVNLDDGKTQHDIYTLAALAAGNFGAVSEMAKIIGEEDFALLFHKGEKDSIHFSKVTDDLLLINVFGKEVSLGFLRLKVAEAITKIKELTGFVGP
ncbi:MAG: roadblock/LC7 domain-containing protein [Proteobacteria bacterium]|nr:roadblock/LC7 domain-containing protein [Pseudomonadota bacterium]